MIFCIKSKLCRNAKIKCLQDITAVYRVHDEGFWTKTSKLQKLENYLIFYKLVYKELNKKQRDIVLIKQKSIIAKISQQRHNTNGVLRVLNRTFLKMKYRLK